MAKAIRDAYGEALVACGLQNENIVVFDADTSGSTKTNGFAAAIPERFFNVGIAEANMVAMAAGAATIGKIPFVNTFGVFLASNGLLSARSYGSYAQLPLKLAGAYCGMSDAFDGPTHHSVEDIAIMRALPNYKVLVPSSALQTTWIVQQAVADPSAMYLRLSRDVFPEIYTSEDTFTLGKGKVLCEGNDVTIIACGLMVSRALQAVEQLKAQGIHASVIDMFSIKPIDADLIVEYAKKTGAIVTAEEHSIIGGLGSAVSEVVCTNGCCVPMQFVGIPDCHGETGPYEKLQEKYGFNTQAIVEKVKQVVALKNIRI